MGDDAGLDVAGCRFNGEDRGEGGNRRRWWRTGGAAEMEADLTMSDCVFLARFMKMCGVDGGCNAECQRNESDQDARHPTKASSRAMTWHGGEAIPFLSAPQIAAFLEGFRVPGRRMTAVGFSIKLSKRYTVRVAQLDGQALPFAARR
jgi:hypothetical protein